MPSSQPVHVGGMIPLLVWRKKLRLGGFEYLVKDSRGKASTFGWDFCLLCLHLAWAGGQPAVASLSVVCGIGWPESWDIRDQGPVSCDLEKGCFSLWAAVSPKLNQESDEVAFWEGTTFHVFKRAWQ